MNGGALEVLLVNARGIRHTNLFGRPAYYVVVECGGQVHRSKVSRGKDNRAWWNEKFRFEFPLPHWRNSTHLKIRVMNLEFFKRGGFVGDTTIYLGGVIMEGLDSGSVEVGPSPYNVVLEDDTYEGEIVVGFKFSVKEEEHTEEVRKRDLGDEGPPRGSFWISVMKLCKWKKVSWWKLLSDLGHGSSHEDRKRD